MKLSIRKYNLLSVLCFHFLQILYSTYLLIQGKSCHWLSLFTIATTNKDAGHLCETANVWDGFL